MGPELELVPSLERWREYPSDLGKWTPGPDRLLQRVIGQCGVCGWVSLPHETADRVRIWLELHRVFAHPVSTS